LLIGNICCGCCVVFEIIVSDLVETFVPWDREEEEEDLDNAVELRGAKPIAFCDKLDIAPINEEKIKRPERIIK